MIDEVLIAGFGGQGIMLMGRLLAYGAINEGLEVTFYSSYGPEMRGGTANCTVVISDERIGSPVRNRFTHLMAMNQASVDKFSEGVKPGGVIAYHQSLVDTPPARTDVLRVGVPANRIALPAQGYTGLSTVGPRARRDAAPGVVRCNAHVDPIAWRDGRRFVGAARALDAVLEHLVRRRQGAVDPDEPTGLLTHHLVFDAEAGGSSTSSSPAPAGIPRPAG